MVATHPHTSDWDDEHNSYWSLWYRCDAYVCDGRGGEVVRMVVDTLVPIDIEKIVPNVLLHPMVFYIQYTFLSMVDVRKPFTVALSGLMRVGP